MFQTMARSASRVEICLRSSAVNFFMSLSDSWAIVSRDDLKRIAHGIDLGASALIVDFFYYLIRGFFPISSIGA